MIVTVLRAVALMGQLADVPALTVVAGKIVHATEEFASHTPPPIPVLPEWSPIKAFGGYGAPLEIRKAARAGVPVAQCVHEVHDRSFWGLGCDCFAF